MISQLIERGWHPSEYPSIIGDCICLFFEHDIYCCNVLVDIELPDGLETTETEIEIIIRDFKDNELVTWTIKTINWDEFEKICELVDCDEIEESE